MIKKGVGKKKEDKKEEREKRSPSPRSKLVWNVFFSNLNC